MTTYHGLCPVCKVNSIEGGKSPVCDSCFGKISQLAKLRQERDHLINWLHHRVRYKSGHLYESATLTKPSEQAFARKMRDRARAAHLTWEQPVPPKSYATRVNEILGQLRVEQLS